MKLLQKTSLYYLVYALFIFGLGAVLFYWVVKIILLDSIDEALHQEKDQIIENLAYEKLIEELTPTPNVQIKRSKLDHALPDKYSIVVVFDSTQNSWIDYRQLNSSYKHNDKYYDISIRQSMEEAEDLLNLILPAEIGLFILFLIGILIMNNYVNAQVWKDFYAMMTQIKEYDFEKTKVIHAIPSDIREFKELSSSLEKMTDRIYQDFVSKKEFNENSSHELQTPLAIIRNKLELLIQSPNLNAHDMEYIQSIFDAVKRLTNLNKGLLLIAQIDNQQYSDATPIRIDILLQKTIDSFSDQFKEKNIQVKIENTKYCVVKINQILAEILFTNLISNAIKHNIPDGSIYIELNNNQFFIENTGKELQKNTIELFERFKKDSNEKTSIGLGLSIVKKICDLFQMQVSYTSLQNKHRLTIQFPEQSIINNTDTME